LLMAGHGASNEAENQECPTKSGRAACPEFVEGLSPATRRSAGRPLPRIWEFFAGSARSFCAAIRPENNFWNAAGKWVDTPDSLTPSFRPYAFLLLISLSIMLTFPHPTSENFRPARARFLQTASGNQTETKPGQPCTRGERNGIY